MFIDIHELQHRRVEFNERFRPDAIDLGPDLRQQTPLTTSGRAELIEERHGRKGKIRDIRVLGKMSTSVEINCARCLEPVLCPVDREFDLLYRPQGVDAGVEEITVTDVEADIGYYQGEGLLLEDVLREQVLLAVPIKTVCSESCKGLCPRCGQNLNSGSCDCKPPEDARWAALKDVQNKLRH
jgi:uncharacterized protein